MHCFHSFFFFSTTLVLPFLALQLYPHCIQPFFGVMQNFTCSTCMHIEENPFHIVWSSMRGINIPVTAYYVHLLTLPIGKCCQFTIVCIWMLAASACLPACLLAYMHASHMRVYTYIWKSKRQVKFCSKCGYIITLHIHTYRWMHGCAPLDPMCKHHFMNISSWCNNIFLFSTLYWDIYTSESVWLWHEDRRFSLCLSILACLSICIYIVSNKNEHRVNF